MGADSLGARDLNSRQGGDDLNGSIIPLSVGIVPTAACDCSVYNLGGDDWLSGLDDIDRAIGRVCRYPQTWG